MEQQFGNLLFALAFLFACSYFIGGILSKLRIPWILGALLVGIAAHTIVQQKWLLGETSVSISFGFLAQLGVLFLLFFIGLQIDLKALRQLSQDIIWITVLNTLFPFLFGVAVMLLWGYGWLVALVVGLTRMPTAEAVIVPILDEFRMVKTRVGSLIIGAGVLDDVIEVFLVAVVSVWIAQSGTTAASLPEEIGSILGKTLVFIAVAIALYRWGAKPIAQWLPPKVGNLVLFAIVVLFILGSVARFAGIGLVVGAIVAGIVVAPVLNTLQRSGSMAIEVFQAVGYGLFGVIFFLWIGMSVDLSGLIAHPALAILLFGAAFFGKLLGVFVMVPMGKIDWREAWTVGIGLNARLTTEIIVAKLLYDAHLIDSALFTALVAASSVSTIAVPLLFVALVRKWGNALRQLPSIAVQKKMMR